MQTEAMSDENRTFEPLLNVATAAKLLQIHPKTLQAFARRGTMPCLRIGKYWKFRESSLDAWVSGRLVCDEPVTAREQKGQ